MLCVISKRVKGPFQLVAEKKRDRRNSTQKAQDAQGWIKHYISGMLPQNKSIGIREGPIVNVNPSPGGHPLYCSHPNGAVINNNSYIVSELPKSSTLALNFNPLRKPSFLSPGRNKLISGPVARFPNRRRDYSRRHILPFTSRYAFAYSAQCFTGIHESQCNHG